MQNKLQRKVQTSFLLSGFCFSKSDRIRNLLINIYTYAVQFPSRLKRYEFREIHFGGERLSGMGRFVIHLSLPQTCVNPNSIGVKCPLTLSGPRFFRYRKDPGGGGIQTPPPFDSSENWQVEYSTYATIKFSVLRVLGLKKAAKFDLFKNVKNQNLHF